MKEDQKPRKPYIHIPLDRLIEKLREFLPSPLTGSKYCLWRRVPMEEWAEGFHVDARTLRRMFQKLHSVGAIQYRYGNVGYDDPEHCRLAEVKATRLLLECPQDISLKKIKPVSLKKQREAELQQIKAEVANEENCPINTSVYTGCCSVEELIDAVGIPKELQELPQWICWRYGKVNEKTGRRPKKPYSAKPGGSNKPIDCTNPLNWTTHEQAKARYEEPGRRKPYDGIGFCFKKGGGIVGIDQDGSLEPCVRSYAELSPSDKGIHIIAYGSIPANRGKNASGIEMYDHGHFFTFTGKHLVGMPTGVEHCQEEIETAYAKTAPAQKPIDVTLATACQLADEELLAKARKAKNGLKFIRLFDEGDWSDYDTHSHADQALCKMLAYWTDNDEEMIDHLFKQSKLYRDWKWDRKARTGETYGQGTIKRALLSE